MDQLNLQALQAMSQADPKSLDMALLDPLKQQLQAAQDNLPEDAPPEMVAQISELQNAVSALSDEQISRLNKLAMELTEDWQKAVKAKRPIEDRWIDDERQFMGSPRIQGSKAYPGDAADSSNNNKDPLAIHATRSRTLMCWGRLADMMLPANDFPMRVDASDEPDPNEFPTLQQAIQDATQKFQQAQQQAQQASQQPQDGSQPPPEMPEPPDPARILENLAEQSANAMQQEVFQMLRDAKFQSQARKALYDCARIGTGLLKGPFPTLKRCRKFGQNQSFDIQETPTAGISWVDPWKWYYDMSPSMDRASATYEVQIMSSRELADFKNYPRALTGVIDELLAEKDPKLEGDFRMSITKRNQYTDMREPLDGVYAVLETHKIIKPDVLKDVMGIEWEYDDLPVIHMWSCNGKCIKFKLSPLERDFRLDYYNFTIMPADDTIFGFGYPYLARAAQRFADGALQATLANAAASVAPMILVAQGKVQPNREQWRIAGLNVFSVENQDGPLENFFASVSVQSNVEQNLELLKVAQDLMDQDTLFNQILQGNVSGEDMPASGIVTMANIASVFQRTIAAYGDDNVFQPLCERLIWWAKLYKGQDDPELMGDMQGKGIAATQLVSKDLALQHTQVAIQMSERPEFAGFSDPYELYKSFMMNIDGLPNRDAIIHDRETALANQAKIQQAQQQGDPAVAAKIASDEKIAQMKMQNDLQIAQGEQQIRLLQAQTQLKVAEMTLQARLVELQTQKDVDITQVSAQIQQASMDDQTKRFQTVLEKTIEARLETAKLNATPSPYSKND